MIKTSIESRIDYCIKSLIRNDYIRSSDVKGASDIEISDLIKKNNLSDLPEDYKIYLKKCGNSKNNDFYIPLSWIDSAKEVFEESMREIELISEIPQRYIVFSGNIDYSFGLIIEDIDNKFEMIFYVIGDDFKVYPIINFIDSLEELTRRLIQMKK